MSISQRHRNFVREPMREKPLEAIAGIDGIYETKLKQRGFVKAYHLLGQFLVMSRDTTAFEAWLECDIGMNAKYRADCARCMEEWCDNNL